MVRKTFHGTLGPDGYVVLDDAELPDREMRVLVTVLEPAIEAPAAESDKAWSFPVVPDAKWPHDMPVSREEMYGDDGRSEWPLPRTASTNRNFPSLPLSF